MCEFHRKSNRPFTAIFPKQIEEGDSVRLKGKIRDNAKLFSINFIADINPIPDFIPYHFKTHFDLPPDIAVRHNHKQSKWGDEIIDQLTWVDGPGNLFDVEFIFQQDTVHIYTDAGTQYRFQFEISKHYKYIKFLQIWDDLDYIESIEFKYKKRNK